MWDDSCIINSEFLSGSYKRWKLWNKYIVTNFVCVQDRLKNDCVLAVQLLHCRPSDFISYRLNEVIARHFLEVICRCLDYYPVMAIVGELLIFLACVSLFFVCNFVTSITGKQLQLSSRIFWNWSAMVPGSCLTIFLTRTSLHSFSFFCYVAFFFICVSFEWVLFLLLVKLITWKDSSPKSPVLCVEWDTKL